jgi:TolA-binding protein
MSQDLDHDDPVPPRPTPPSKPSGPRLNIPTPPNLPHDDPEHGSRHRGLSMMVGLNFLLLLILIVMMGLVMLGKVDLPVKGDARPEDSKSVSTEVDQLKSEITGLTKKVTAMAPPADPAPQIKAVDDKVAELFRTMAEIPGRLEALNQKVDASLKGDTFAPAPRVDAIEKKVGELAQAVDSLKAGLPNRPTTAATPSSADSGSENPAMTEAADLFKKGKYVEAKEAFNRLQTTSADDARVWYYSALANSLATGDWRGESVRLATTGVEKEKAGSPERSKIDAAFAGLSVNTGKDWLAFFRNKAAQ